MISCYSVMIGSSLFAPRLTAHSSHHSHSRNNWYKSGSSGKKFQTRRLQWLDRGGAECPAWRPIEWSAVIKLMEQANPDGLVFGKLTTKHVYLTSKVQRHLSSHLSHALFTLSLPSTQTIMNVELARTVLSKKTSKMFDTFGEGKDYQGVVEFTANCDKLFTAFGSPSSAFGLHDLNREVMTGAKAAMEW